MHLTAVLALAALASVGSCGAIDPHAWQAPLPGYRESDLPKHQCSGYNSDPPSQAAARAP